MAWLCHSRGFPATFLRPLRTCKNQAAKQQMFLDILSKSVDNCNIKSSNSLQKNPSLFLFQTSVKGLWLIVFHHLGVSLKIFLSPPRCQTARSPLGWSDISMTCRQKSGASLRVFGNLCERRSVWGYLLSTAKKCSNMSPQCHTTNINKRHEGSLQETT